MAAISELTPLQFALAIHTASPELGLALSNAAGELRYQIWDLGRALSTDLQLKLQEFIQPFRWSNLAFLAVAKGPGGFTGTRIGVVAARTIAQQLEVPLFAVSTLAAVAWESRADGVEHVAVQMRAQRGEMFVAVYAVQSEETTGRSPAIEIRLPEQVMSLAQWQQTLTDWPRPYHLVQIEGGLGTSAASILELAILDWQQGARPHWSDALPFYGQSPV